MNYPMQLADMQNDVLSRLGESFNSPAGLLPTGTGGAAVIATLQTATDYLNEAAADLARMAQPLPDMGTCSLGSGVRYLSFNALTLSSGNFMWAARAVVWDGMQLQHCKRAKLERWFPTYLTDASGDPQYWYEFGTSIGFYPVPASTETVSVDGLVTPKPMVEGSDTLPFEPDQIKLVIFQAAGRLAVKNVQNTSLAARGQVWMGAANTGFQATLLENWQRDPDLMRAHYPQPGTPVAT